MNSRFVRVIVLCGLLLGLTLPSAGFSATECTDDNHNGKIRLNEFSPNPGPNQKEWIELFLYKGEALSLDGWELHDATGKIATLSGVVTQDAPFLLVELSSSKLNNTGDTIILKGEDASTRDTMQYTTATEHHETYAYDPSTSQFIITTTPTPGQPNTLSQRTKETEENSSPSNQTPAPGVGEPEPHVLQGTDSSTSTQTVLVNNLLITEVFPNPDDEIDEFIELYNPNTSTISLAGWTLKDNGKTPHELGGDIGAQSYRVIGREESGIALNNTGSESVFLLAPDGSTIASTTYENAPEPQSWSRDDTGVWSWTTTVTPGATNHISVPAQHTVGEPTGLIPFVPLSDVSQVELGTMITTKGTVSVVPGVLGSQFFYINGSGIQVYMFTKDFPGLQIGDEVAVTGELTESNGELRIKTKIQDDILVIGTKELSPTVLPIGEIAETMTAHLVQTSGTVTEKTTDHLYIDDGSHEIKVSAKALTTARDAISVSQSIVVTGILRPRSDGLVIFPRGDADITIETASSTPIATSGSGEGSTTAFDLPLFQSGLVFIGAGFLLVLFRKHGTPEIQQPLPNPVNIKTGLEPQLAELMALHSDLR